MTSASRVSRFSTRKSAWWTAWSSVWPLKRWLSQMNSWSQKSRTFDPKTQELLIPNLDSNDLLIPNLADCGRHLLLHNRECHGLSSLYVTWDTGFGRDWYATTLGQWHIVISFICSVDNLIILEIYCESLSGCVSIWRITASEELISKFVKHCLCGKCHKA